MINLIIISPIIHKLLKNLDVGGVNGYCDHLDVISNVLGALTTVEHSMPLVQYAACHKKSSQLLL